MSARSKKDYERIRAIVSRVIAAWDPYSLLANGTLPDEFDEEVDLFTARVLEIGSPESAAIQLSRVSSQQEVLA